MLPAPERERAADVDFRCSRWVECPDHRVVGPSFGPVVGVDHCAALNGGVDAKVVSSTVAQRSWPVSSRISMRPVRCWNPLPATATSSRTPATRPLPADRSVYPDTRDEIRRSGPSHCPSVTISSDPLLLARAATARPREGATAPPASPSTTASKPSSRIAATTLGVQRRLRYLGTRSLQLKGFHGEPCRLQQVSRSRNNSHRPRTASGAISQVLSWRTYSSASRARSL